MPINLSLIILIVAVLVWIFSLARRSRAPFVVDALDAVFLVLVAIYFHIS